MISFGQLVELIGGGHDPYNAIRAHGPAATATSVLRHDCHRLDPGAEQIRAHVGGLKEQRIQHAVRIKVAEAKIGGVGNIAGPYIVPALASLKAVTGDGLAIV